MPVLLPECECCGRESRTCHACPDCGRQCCRTCRSHGKCLHCAPRGVAFAAILPYLDPVTELADAR